MSRTIKDKSYFTFVKGLNTEASALNFPDNFSVDEENFDLNIDGSRRRRLGMDYQDGFVDAATSTQLQELKATLKLKYLSVIDWPQPGGDATKHFVVVAGEFLHVYDVLSDPITTLIPMVESTTGAENIIMDIPIGNTLLAQQQVKTGTVVNGMLVVVGGGNYPAFLIYDSLTNKVYKDSLLSGLTARPRERDIDGITSLDTGGVPLLISDRPATLTETHHYNLLNQGWKESRIVPFGAPDNGYPSNVDTYSAGFTSTLAFAASQIDSVYEVGNATPAPTGRLTIDVLHKTRAGEIADQTKSVLSTLQDVDATTSFTTSTSFAGRLWLSGLTDQNNIGNVYFSQVGISQDTKTKIIQLSSFHQKADPTSPTISDLVDSDGGKITIQEAGAINKLSVFGNSVIVFSNQGVWSISGVTDSGFSATSFQVKKLSSSGASSPNSVVQLQNAIYYLSIDGLANITPDQFTGAPVVKVISKTVIQSLIDDIPDINKKHVTGFFSIRENEIKWLYNNNTLPVNSSFIFGAYYNRVLVFDLTLEAFYKIKLETIGSTEELTTTNFETTPFIVGAITLSNKIVPGNNYKSSEATDMKFLTMVPFNDGADKWGLWWSAMKDTSFTDWQSFDSIGTPVNSFLETGHEIFQDGMRKKQPIYIFCYLNQTETNYIDDGSGNIILENPSSCLLKAKWDWTDNTNSGLFSKQQQVYRIRRLDLPTGTLPQIIANGFPVVVTKNKVRGQGKSIRLRFDTEVGKDCWLLGWATTVTAGKDI